MAGLGHGASTLDGNSTRRVYADPVGHPFCLYPGLTAPTDRLGVMYKAAGSYFALWRREPLRRSGCGK